jgi:hypothetical protein
MLHEVSIECRFAASAGPSFADARDWITAITDGEERASFATGGGVVVPIDFIEPMRALMQSAYSNQYKAFFEQPEYVADPFSVTLFRDAILLRNGVLLTGLGSDASCVTETLGHSVRQAVEIDTQNLRVKKATDDRALYIKFDQTELQPIESSNTLNIVFSNVNNYGHWHVHNVSFCIWLADHLPNLIRKLDVSTVVLWIPHGMDHLGSGMKNRAVEAISKIVAVKFVDPNHLNPGVRLGNTVVSSTFNIDRGPRWPAVFSNLFQKIRLPRDESAPARIYCNRSHAGRRGIENEPELEDALRRVGFTVVEPGRMTYDQQRITFSNASVVVGSHGAALTNTIFSHLPLTLVELTHPFYGTTQYGWFQNLAAVMGNRYGALINEVPEQSRGVNYNETYFRIDVDKILSVLQSIGVNSV